ncbi:hypothetical protein ACMD2_14204 [Ananas comosus]|uniref:Uncharacterized protein n=1 Tax=Ananas comosus TaxID=4615 RepID=A0A199VAM2_ANACO|nr:hypothetical protein ACMD2_14204 [Ananas comosus]
MSRTFPRLVIEVTGMHIPVVDEEEDPSYFGATSDSHRGDDIRISITDQL